MKLGEKIRYLREVEGSLRGLGRPITQQEMVKAVRQELRKSISQSYLSQIENGARPHMTQSSRALLAKFFKVHPGFLVDDPEGYHTELTSDLRTTEGQLDVWLLQGSERFVSDPEVSDVLIKAAREKDAAVHDPRADKVEEQFAAQFECEPAMTDLALLRCLNASVVAEAFNPLPQISIVVQVGLTHSSALRYCAEADRLPLYNQPFDRVLRSATSISGF